jgi:hypothetical protein
MRYLLLIALLMACLAWLRRRHKRRSDGELAAGTLVDVAWSWLLSWWPRPPSTVAVTNRLVRWARAERLPISRDRFLAPSRLVIGLHPDEHAALEGRLTGVEVAIAESMADAAAENGWRSQGPPTVHIRRDDTAAIGWPRIQASYESSSPQRAVQERRREDAEPQPTIPVNGTTRLLEREAGTVLTGSHLRMPDGQCVSLPRSGRTVLGRGHAADIAVVHPEVSKHHLAIATMGSSVWIEDLGSTNGTYINDRAVAGRVELAADARIRLGTHGPIVTYVTSDRAK